MPEIDDTSRLHKDVQHYLDNELRQGERPVVVVNGNGPTGAVVTDQRVLMFGRDVQSEWDFLDIDGVTFDGTSLTLRGARLTSGVRAVTVFPEQFAKATAGVAKAAIERLSSEAIRRKAQTGYLSERGALHDMRPLVLIKAYGKPDPDPSDRQKALPFVKQLPSTVIREANADAALMAVEGYYPVAMAWFDAGSQASSLMAFNAGVTEQQLVLTVTYRLELRPDGDRAVAGSSGQPTS